MRAIRRFEMFSYPFPVFCFCTERGAWLAALTGVDLSALLKGLPSKAAYLMRSVIVAESRRLSICLISISHSACVLV